ncbi:unnamed protein product [Acanthosepion pharaonis]|uniref:Transmembrane protein n=1 Tax=Acanthosepion pharaonis TaxID=158019 RepID=A0A812DME9_ACAPH|nr:unnamed protein product [Sepia pharaonis]
MRERLRASFSFSYIIFFLLTFSPDFLLHFHLSHSFDRHYANGLQHFLLLPSARHPDNGHDVCKVLTDEESFRFIASPFSPFSPFSLVLCLNFHFLSIFFSIFHLSPFRRLYFFLFGSSLIPSPFSFQFISLFLLLSFLLLYPFFLFSLHTLCVCHPPFSFWSLFF